MHLALMVSLADDDTFNLYLGAHDLLSFAEDITSTINASNFAYCNAFILNSFDYLNTNQSCPDDLYFEYGVATNFNVIP